MTFALKLDRLIDHQLTETFSRGLFRKEKMLYCIHLVISQATAYEHFHRQMAERVDCEQSLDYDATNLRTFLAVGKSR